MFDRIKDYIVDERFQFTFNKNKLNVVNYKEIITLEESRISFECDLGILTIKGERLTINKLLDKEVLITGEIKSIEIL